MSQVVEEKIAVREACPAELLVNDVQSQLNETRVALVCVPGSLEELQAIVRAAGRSGLALSVAGGRHAMGGQQFAADGVLIDMSGMRRVLRFDAERALIEVEAGIQWPELIDYTVRAQAGRGRQVGIAQKQTGADRLSLGGALAANMHGRGLNLKPIIADVESFVLVDARGRALTCSRTENVELFRLAIGGYGLFGVIASVTLRLAPRRKLERQTVVADVRDLHALFAERAAAGFLYGDFQVAIDRASEGFLRTGCFPCYRPAPDDAPVTGEDSKLSAEDWMGLYYLAHANPGVAFEMYANYYLSTSGQVFWSDTHQLNVFVDDYHRTLDARLGAEAPGSEMNTEVYVPRESLAAFMEAVREDFVRDRTELIYGTIRVIERDDESFLAWAREPFACAVFTIHVTHSAAGREKAEREFRGLIDRAVEFGGSYFLTYHRWARREQVLACYPQLPEFLRLKREYDPSELFQSDWYRHHRAMFSDSCGVSPLNLA